MFVSSRFFVFIVLIGLWGGTFVASYGAEGKACRGEIRNWRGYPGVWVNGIPMFPMAFLMHQGDFDREYSQMAAAGIRFFTMAAPIGNTPEGFNPQGCDEPFLKIIRQQPNALIFPRVDVTAPVWWLEKHPDDRVVFDDGSVGPQSMFSKAWRSAACEWIESYARYIRNSSYAPHVLGIHICTGYTGEWQSWGLWDDLRGDFSPVALDAWRNFLKRKYKSDRRLKEAWGREISIADAEIPSRQRREETNNGLLRDPHPYQDVIDFYEFYSEGTTQAIEEIAAAAKRGGGKEWLVGVFYGYAIQYGGKVQESQHLGMRRLLDCPHIDFFCSPAMYTFREPGGTSTFMSYTDSIRQRRKFWWHEADNRTHLTPNNPVCPARNLFESLNVLKREFANVWAHHVGMWWFDMEGGWYDDPEIVRLFQGMIAWTHTAPSQWEPKTEVAVFVDDKSNFRIRPDEPYLNHCVTEFMSQMPRLGAPYHTFLLADISRVGQYKLYVFPNAFDLTPEERRAIEELKRRDVSLVFFGPAGMGKVNRGRVSSSSENMQRLLGFLPKDEPCRTEKVQKADVFWYRDSPPSIDELRNIARNAGVFIYHSQPDAFYVGNGLVALHGSDNTGTEKVIRFPHPIRYSEVLCDAPLCGEGTELRFSLVPRETRCFSLSPCP